MKAPIDWSRLLQRPAAALPNATPSVTDKRVLITGAGGSIGLALAEQLGRSSPQSLVLLDAAEHALYALSRTLTVAHRPVLGSVADRSLLDALFREYRPEIIFHAAAFKHVTIVEQNPFAGMANNALATASLAEQARSHGVEQFIFVSTDKAVEPVSMMGASKRIAELILLGAPRTATAFKVVRLSNVLGSRGSVVPLFLDQIERREPLTVAAAQVRRYFMTVDECVHALTEALTCDEALLASYPGDAIPILELANFLAEDAGFPRHPVRFTGLGPADKWSEQLLGLTEIWAGNAPSSGRLRAIHTSAPDMLVLAEALEQLRHAVSVRHLPHLIAAVQMLIPEYRPSSLLSSPGDR